MVVGGVSYNGKLNLIKVPLNAKVNSDYFIIHVLLPVYKQVIKLYHTSDHKMVRFHQDQALVHV